jgi:uncharacterized protein
MSLLDSMYRNSLWLLIRIYQLFLSPFLGGACRFYPSCSHYAIDCIEHDSKPLTKILIRLSKCHPFHPGGIDER